ncbi:MAG TPA: hypothetical protein VGC79_36710 [Polyangiaceae bacterium]
MRALGSWSLLLAASFASSLALAEPAGPSPAPAAAAPPPEPTPPAPPAPPSPPEPVPAAAPPVENAAPATSAVDSAPSAAVAAPAATSPSAAQVRAEEMKPVGEVPPLLDAEPPHDFTRNFRALPLTLEARFGFNARLSSSFDDTAQEERWGASYAFASYLAWKPEFALGLELDYSGLGRVRALSGQSSADNQYSATGAWIGARVFPLRGRRVDLFVNLRVGMIWQHVDALGTRQMSGSITEPAQSYSCSEWSGPGLGLSGGLGLAYRLGRHIALVSRLDLNGTRLSGEALGTCADGIGSVASLGGSVGLAFEFETAPK